MINLFDDIDEWKEKLLPIIIKYKGRKHPLQYHNLYQLVVMVILSAQDSDANINTIAPNLFEVFPNMESLSITNKKTLLPYITNVNYFDIKTDYLLEIGKTIQKDQNIPLTMRSLISLKGIGHKSANVIMREFNIFPQGIMVDLHVIRVVPRIGLTLESKNGIKIEKQLMQILPNSIWGEIGMAISFLGREICRPQPKCDECPINTICDYYKLKFRK